MPKVQLEKSKTSKKSGKVKLSPAERSQVAKDRWAKIRSAKAAQVLETSTKEDNPITVTWPTEEEVKALDAPMAPSPYIPEPTNPTPYVAPVAPKKQKRYTGPKEFSVALKAAENRLAKAIEERAKLSGQLAALQAEIPSLLQIIAALKGPQMAPAPPYDFSSVGIPPVIGGVQGYPNPIPQQHQGLDLAAIQAAMAVPAASRAQGGAIQFGPEVLGALEGPEDDIDKFITGPAASGAGWIGG
jgi:hypothetical protein